MLKWAYIIYLPIFFALSAAQEVAEYAYLKSFNDQSKSRETIVILVVVINIVKLAWTSALFLTALKFAR